MFLKKPYHHFRPRALPGRPISFPFGPKGARIWRWFCLLAIPGVLIAPGCGEPRLGLSSTPEEPQAEQEPPPVPPPGMTIVTERFFNANGEDGWGLNSGGANRYQSDLSAPIDPPIVLVMPFGPCTNCGSNGMGNKVVRIWRDDGLPVGRELWIEAWVKYSPNWANNPSGINKIFYPAVVGQVNHPATLVARGIGSDADAPLRLALGIGGQDNSVCGHHISHWINGQRPGADIPRGQWVNIKLYVRTNDYGQCNALARAWVNDVLAFDRDDFIFVEPGVSQNWWGINFDPVWGGGRGDLPAEQTLSTAYLVAMIK